MIAVEQVSFTYPGSGGAGVGDVSLTITEGELMAVIGPSGCGKSTVLKLIAGFLAPSSGRILIGGQDVADVPPRARDLGIVFQSYALFPHMTVAGNVAYPLKLRRLPQAAAAERVRDTLAMVGLLDLAERSPRSLSGGQQQRVALARALVFRPRALLLDEPLSALDAALRAEMRDEIRRLQQHYGIATLHITHDQEEALSMADKVAVMQSGRLLQIGTPQAVYRAPASRAVAAFVGHANLIEGEALDPTHVKTPLGVLTCAAHAYPAGAAVTVLVRPEAIRPADDSSPNVVPGRVTRDRFLGAMRRFDFATAAGPVLTVETDDIRLSPDRLTLPPDALRILASDTGAGGPASARAYPQDHP